MSKFKVGDRVVVIGTIKEVDEKQDIYCVQFSQYTLSNMADGPKQDEAIVSKISVSGLAEDTAIRNTLQAKANNKRQVDGSHYQKQGVQPWDYIAANTLDWFQGEIIKYVTRWRDKGKMKDLEKAQNVLEKYIEVESSLVK